MKYFLLLSCLTIAKAGVIKEESDEKCDGYKIDNVYYDKDVIIEGYDRPYMLAVDNNTNTLYFSYSLKKEEDYFKTAKVDLYTNNLVNLDIVNGFAQTVDQKTREVYIGTNDGIYKYNPKNNEAVFFGQRGSDIWSIYFRHDVLYFSEFPSQFLYALINDTVVRFQDLEDTKVDQFVIDNEDTIFFTTATELYGQKKGTKESVLYGDFSSYGPRGITINGLGDVFLCLRDGIYKVNKAEKDLKKIVDVDDCFGIAFDKDNYLIYADSKSIVRLSPNSDSKC